MPFIPHTESDVREMLATIGAPTTAALFDEIPPELICKGLHGVPEGLGCHVEPGQVAFWVVAPYHRGSVESGQRVPEPILGALSGDGRAVENQCDGLATFGLRAAGEFVALEVDLDRDGRQSGVDERADRQ